MSKQTYGLIGYPLGHSFSRKYFTEKFKTEDIDAEYLNFEIPEIELFTDILTQHPNLCGINVTIPYKERIIPFLDELDSKASKIGAVNVIKVIRSAESGKPHLIGYNSDMIGFQNSIAPLINKNIHHKALILGTGGASKAIIQALIDLGVECRYVSRTKSDSRFCYEELDEQIMSEYMVIVNTSPVGTYPNIEDAPAIPYHLLTNQHLLYDLVYNPDMTKFLQRGKDNGATVKNGAEMLQLQADASWLIWNK